MTGSYGRNSTSRFFLIVLLTVCLSPLLWATDGTQLIGIGALQKGTGGAGIASPKDMTWVLLNPASIIDLGSRLDVSLEIFAPSRSLESHGLFGNGRAGKMDDDSIFFIPSMGYSRCCRCGERAWGLGLYGVSGMGVEYSSSRSIWPRIFGQNYDRNTEYSVAKFVCAYAHSFGDDWVLGLAPHLNYARFKTDMLSLSFRQVAANNDWDDSFGLGFSLGLYKRWDRFGIGATYTSRQWMSQFQEYEDLFFESMDLPQSFQAGMVYDFSPSFEWVLDYKWINWSGVDQMAETPIKGGFGWKDQHVIKTGLTWYATPKWTFRSGLSHAKAPIDEEHVFANALFPALTEDHVSLGFSYAINEKSDFHFTYMHAFKNELKDSGRGDLFSLLGRATEISLKENTMTFAYSYKFQRGNDAKRRLNWKNKSTSSVQRDCSS